MGCAGEEKRATEVCGQALREEFGHCRAQNPPILQDTLAWLRGFRSPNLVSSRSLEAAGGNLGGFNIRLGDQGLLGQEVTRRDRQR